MKTLKTLKNLKEGERYYWKGKDIMSLYVCENVYGGGETSSTYFHVEDGKVYKVDDYSNCDYRTGTVVAVASVGDAAILMSKELIKLKKRQKALIQALSTVVNS